MTQFVLLDLFSGDLINTGLRDFISSVLYALLGFVLLYGGYRVFDWLTPTDLQKDIFVDGNKAVAILVGAFILALAIVIAAAIH